MSAPATEAPADPTQHPAMRRFAAAVRALYGARQERIVLYGSRTRGDAREDSDWDVAIFLYDVGGWWAEAQNLGGISLEILLDIGINISPTIFEACGYSARTMLMHELRREGRDL
jgi:hypothetical protein